MFSQSNMVEFKMAALIKLSQNEWVKGFFFVQMVGTNLGKCEWVLRGKTKVGWIQDGQIKDGRIQDGCH